MTCSSLLEGVTFIEPELHSVTAVPLAEHFVEPFLNGTTKHTSKCLMNFTNN